MAKGWPGIALMAIAFGALGLWLIPELIGVFSPAVEDTYSEWVFDLDLWAVLGIAGLHGIAGVVLIWSAGHFIEGESRRRDIERKTYRSPTSSGGNHFTMRTSADSAEDADKVDT